MKKIHYIVIILISILSLSSCASFSGKIVRDKTTPLTKENIKSIEGTYAIESYDSYFQSTYKKKEVIQFSKSKGVSNIHYFTGAENITSTMSKKLVVAIKLLSKKEIKFTYKLQDSIVEEIILDMKLRGNGMIHLKNKEVNVMGIPMIFGNITVDKSRIGLSNNSDLIINNVHFLAGGVLILIGDSRRKNTTFYFKRLTSLS